MRKGFTLIELLVVIAIIAVLGGLMCGGCRVWSQTGPTGKSWGETFTTYEGRIVKTYTHTSGGGEDTSAFTSKRADIQTIDGKRMTVTCDDSYWNDIKNSATSYGKFEDDHWYEIKTIGWRDEYYSYFPNVKSVKEIPAPE